MEHVSDRALDAYYHETETRYTDTCPCCGHEWWNEDGLTMCPECTKALAEELEALRRSYGGLGKLYWADAIEEALNV